MMIFQVSIINVILIIYTSNSLTDHNTTLISSGRWLLKVATFLCQFDRSNRHIKHTDTYIA